MSHRTAYVGGIGFAPKKSIETGAEELPDSKLANIITCREMPNADVSARTQATRTIGALNMMVHLAEGEWSPSSREDMGEFLGRIVANAQRQGIEVTVVDASPSS